jgi:hypothetical protein
MEVGWLSRGETSSAPARLDAELQWIKVAGQAEEPAYRLIGQIDAWFVGLWNEMRVAFA